MRICGKLCESGEVRTITLERGKIVEFGAPAEDCDLGGPNVWLTPGFHDVQVNGYGGHDFNVGAWGSADEVSTDLAPIFAAAARAGTALLCPTITTNSHEGLIAGLSALTRAVSSDPAVARAVSGIHLEGPYIGSEDGPRGAHPLEHVRDPDWEEFQSLQDAAEGRIRIVTLAPERSGALPFIEKLSATGVVVAIGHTGAEPETIRDAVHAGARMSTHLGNGGHALVPRHRNYIWEQLASDDLYASIIADGHHLPASVLKTFVRAKSPDRLVLVSDAVSLGGLSPGVYDSGKREVLPSGKVVLAGTPYLSGAGHLLDTCVANAVRLTDLTLAQAVRCATEIPARLLDLRSKGRLQIGADADLTLFRFPDEGPLEIVATLRGGDIVYRA
jgi:N-acetylglucosamine-6-phosphate deacetylase